MTGEQLNLVGTANLVLFFSLLYANYVLRRKPKRGIKVYADANRAIYKDADKILLDWHESRALSDTHEATLIDVKKL